MRTVYTIYYLVCTTDPFLICPARCTGPVTLFIPIWHIVFGDVERTVCNRFSTIDLNGRHWLPSILRSSHT